MFKTKCEACEETLSFTCSLGQLCHDVPFVAFLDVRCPRCGELDGPDLRHFKDKIESLDSAVLRGACRSRELILGALMKMGVEAEASEAWLLVQETDWGAEFIDFTLPLVVPVGTKRAFLQACGVETKTIEESDLQFYKYDFYFFEGEGTCLMVRPSSSSSRYGGCDAGYPDETKFFLFSDWFWSMDNRFCFDEIYPNLIKRLEDLLGKSLIVTH